MKKIILILLAVIATLGCYSQTKAQLELFNSYKDSKYFVVKRDSIVVLNTIESIFNTKEDLYKRVKDFLHNYYEGQDIQYKTDDFESGVIKLRVYSDILAEKKNAFTFFRSQIYDAYFILNIDFKDGQAVITSSVREINYLYKGETSIYQIINYSPFTKEKFRDKEKQTEAFLRLVEKMNRTVFDMSQFLKN